MSPTESTPDPVFAYCGKCRHFSLSMLGRHSCLLGLGLVDGVLRRSCDSFDPFPRIESTSEIDLSE